MCFEMESPIFKILAIINSGYISKKKKKFYEHKFMHTNFEPSHHRKFSIFKIFNFESIS